MGKHSPWLCGKAWHSWALERLSPWCGQDFESSRCQTEHGDDGQVKEKRCNGTRPVFASCLSRSLHSCFFLMWKLIVFLRMEMHALMAGGLVHVGKVEIGAWSVTL